jgi:hypothetical protein
MHKCFHIYVYYSLSNLGALSVSYRSTSHWSSCMQLKGACIFVTIKSFKGVFICKNWKIIHVHVHVCPHLHTQPYEAKKLTKEFFVITKKTNIVTNHI